MFENLIIGLHTQIKLVSYINNLEHKDKTYN